MDKISKNFNRREFRCRCGCGFDTVDVLLIQILEDVRARFGQPVQINSGCRCETYNRSIGGVESSQHTEARAADIVVKNTSPSHVAEYLDTRYPHALGIGRYKTFTHIDTRTGKARWQG